VTAEGQHHFLTFLEARIDRPDRCHIHMSSTVETSVC
jgi:hypothetical protein